MTCFLLILHPPLSSLALTCGRYDDMYTEFEWDSCLDNTTQPLLAVNLSVDVNGESIEGHQNEVLMESLIFRVLALWPARHPFGTAWSSIM